MFLFSRPSIRPFSIDHRPLDKLQYADRGRKIKSSRNRPRLENLESNLKERGKLYEKVACGEPKSRCYE